MGLEKRLRATSLSLDRRLCPSHDLGHDQSVRLFRFGSKKRGVSLGVGGGREGRGLGEGDVSFRVGEEAESHITERGPPTLPFP